MSDVQAHESSLLIVGGRHAVAGTVDVARATGNGTTLLRRSVDAIAAINDRLLDWYGIVALFVLWECSSRWGWIDNQFFPPPSIILAEGWKLAATGELFLHVLVSLQRIFSGLGAAIVAGIPLGFVLVGWFPGFTQFMRPLLRVLSQINAFTLFPVFVLFFGIGELAKFSVIFWSCLWPILFTTIAGVKEVDPLLLKVARSMGGGRMVLSARVLLPGALPSIFTGVRLGAATAFLMLIAAEMIGSSAGLGWLVYNSSVNYSVPRIYLAATVIAALGMGLNRLVYFTENFLIRWREPIVVR